MMYKIGSSLVLLRALAERQNSNDSTSSNTFGKKCEKWQTTSQLTTVKDESLYMPDNAVREAGKD